MKTGPATSRNALRLLDVMQYPVAIVQQATAEAEEFTTQHSWKIFATQSK